MICPDLRKVGRGEPLEVPASAYNAFVDAAKAHRAEQLTVGRKTLRDQTLNLVMIRNDSGGAVGQYGILVVDEPVLLPSVNETIFKNELALSCIEPIESGPSGQGRFVVLVEPLADEAVGLAAVSGVVQVKIDIVDEDHEFADIIGGETGYLESAETGSAQILWSAPGSGVKWCVVRLSNPAPAAAVGVPAGVTTDYAGNTVPDGWLLCDGSSVLRADYPDLFIAIGVLWGSVDGTHFNLPDSDGKTVRGFGTAPFNVVGAIGGFEAVSVKHTHQGFCVATEAYGTFFTVSWDWSQTTNQSLDNWNGTASGTVTKPSGANHQFDNRGPWQCMKRIIKT